MKIQSELGVLDRYMVFFHLDGLVVAVVVVVLVETGQ